MSFSRERKKMRRHARKRALERYQIGDLSLDSISRSIQEGKATFVRQGAKRVKLFDVPYTTKDRGEIVLRTVYDTRRKEIITFLSPP